MIRALQNLTFFSPNEECGLFRSDWWKGAVVSQLISGGNRRARFVGAMRTGQNSPIDKLLKRPAREAWPLAPLPARRASRPEGRAYALRGTEEKPILFKKI